MLPLPKLLLAMAGGIILSVPLYAQAAGGLPESNVSRGGRYDPALVKSGTSAHAVSLCILVAQKDSEPRGRVMGIDIQSIAQIKRGFDVRGSIMVKQVADGLIVTADFRCITAGASVTKMTIMKWSTPA
jgi:hypothetical protein